MKAGTLPANPWQQSTAVTVTESRTPHGAKHIFRARLGQWLGDRVAWLHQSGSAPERWTRPIQASWKWPGRYFTQKREWIPYAGRDQRLITIQHRPRQWLGGCLLLLSAR